MRKLVTLLFTIFAISAGARQITPEEAADIASEFFNPPSASRSGAKVDITRAKNAATASDDMQPYYVFNGDGDKGFVIVAGDNRARKILGFSDTGRFDFNNLPPQLEWLLGEYANEIKALASSPEAQANTEPTDDPRAPIEPLITTRWGQREPYNNSCPIISGKRAITGCVATAFAQVMNYHKWPERGRGSHSYEWEGETYSIDFSQIEFDWDAMLDYYDSNSSERSKEAVATLMKACGYSLETIYSPTGSGASDSYIENAVETFFDYSSMANSIRRNDYTEEQWEGIIYSQLAKGLPVIYSGYPEDSLDGHCFICDGYKGNGFFHFNWGWNGGANGFFLMSGSNADLNGYNYAQSCVINLFPSNKKIDFLSDGTFTYLEIGDKNLALIGSANSNQKVKGDVILPDKTEINGTTYVVATIANTFSDILDLENLTGLDIRTPLTIILEYSFYNAKNLQSIKFPASLDAINHHAFYGCSGLTGDLNIPDAVTSIGYRAFQGCSGLNGNLHISNSIIKIASNTFEGCSELTGYLNIPNSVTYIGGGAFLGCSGLTGDLNIPNSVTYIGSRAFLDCSGLTGDLNIPNSVTSIAPETFAGCSGLTGNLNIPNSVTTIGFRAFEGCSGLTGNLIIPNSVTFIGDNAFNSCSGLTGTLNIPNSVTTIEPDVFNGCKGLTGDLNIPNSLTYIEPGTFAGCSGLSGNLTIPNTITSIGRNAFLGCSGLTGELNIPNSVAAIGDNAFEDCCGFTGSLIIPNSITSIGYYVFSGCSGLTGDLNIPNSVTSIGDGAFYGCSGLTGKLIIPNSVTTIGNWSFEDCGGLTGELIMPNSVTSIGNGAFYGCSGLTGDLNIPNSVTSLGVSAFSNCKGFNGNLNIPNSVTTISSSVFASCKGLTGNLNIPNSVTTIESWAFLGCSGLTGELIIPNSVTSIGDLAFESCRGLTGNLNIPNSVTTLGERAFLGCSGFTGELIIPNSVTSIGFGTFQGCSGFTGTINIPNSVTTIGDWAFEGCSGFTGTINIPNSVTSIGKYAFWTHNNQNVKIETTNPPTIDKQPFFGSLYIGIPTGAGADYRAVEEWAALENLYEFGDANLDRKLTVSDAVAVTNTIIEAKNSSFNDFIADINFDEAITADDATGIVDAVLHYDMPETPSTDTGVMPLSNDVLAIDDFSIDADGKATADVRLSSNQPAVALQCDFIAANGLEIESIKPAAAIAETHTLKTQNLDNGHTRLVLFSTENKAINADNSPLFTIHMRGNNGASGSLHAEMISASTPDATDIELHHTGGNNTGSSGIIDITHAAPSVIGSNGAITILNAAGLPVEIYSIDGRRVASFDATSDVESRQFSGGIYVVKIANTTTKVVL